MQQLISKLTLSAVVLGVTAFGVGTSRAENVIQVEPLQAHVTQLRDYTAVVYYTILNNGDYEIVATYGSNSRPFGSAQHRLTLPVGQSASFALGQEGTGTAPASTVKVTALPTTITIAQY